jgi:hypothetical protein
MICGCRGATGGVSRHVLFVVAVALEMAARGRATLTTRAGGGALRRRA